MHGPGHVFVQDICLCDPVHITVFSVSGFILNTDFKIVCNSKTCWLKVRQIYMPRGYLLTGDSITKCTFHWNFLDHGCPCQSLPT